MRFLLAQPLAGSSDPCAVSGPLDSLLGDHRGGKGGETVHSQLTFPMES